MKINKIFTPIFTFATLSTVVIPLSSCSGGGGGGGDVTETQQNFSFGNSKLYTPKKAALAKQEGKTKLELGKMWADAIAADPTIFYDDVHYAIDREMYRHEDQRDNYTILPQGTINFTWFKVDTKDYTISFEIEYTFNVERNKDKPSLHSGWNKYELEGRIDFYDVPLLSGEIETGSSLAQNSDQIPYFAFPLNDPALTGKNWYVHAIEIGYVYDNDGYRFDTAHNGWISGYNQSEYTPNTYPFGYFMNAAPFVYDRGVTVEGKTTFIPFINFSNYYFINNVEKA